MSAVQGARIHDRLGLAVGAQDYQQI
jgi:hypothetical protein